MLKRYKQLFENQEDLGWEEEPDEDDVEYYIIKWNSDLIRDPFIEDNNAIYILQDIVDKDNIILAKDFNHKVIDIDKYYDILTKDELERYIYSNRCFINICYPAFEKYKWKNLPAEFKDKL